MRAEAKFANPDDAQMTITLRGTLKEFTDLSSAMLSDDSALPYWQTRALIDAISEAARKLRGAVWTDCDSDQSPQGRDAQRLDAKHAGAVAKPIAKRLPCPPNGTKN